MTRPEGTIIRSATMTAAPRTEPQSPSGYKAAPPHTSNINRE
jgi:hypothetical protein